MVELGKKRPRRIKYKHYLVILFFFFCCALVKMAVGGRNRSVLLAGNRNILSSYRDEDLTNPGISELRANILANTRIKHNKL